MSWWKSYFDEAFFHLHKDLFPEQESRREVSGVLELSGVPQFARILDAPCGWGRHTSLFAEAGLVAFGADISLPLLHRTPRSTRTAPARYAAADLRALPYCDGTFDAVVNLFTSLGLFLEDAEDLRALRETLRVLRPGGTFLLESMHRDDVIASYAERDEWTLPNGTEVQVRRRFDPVTGISRERLRWRRGEETGLKRHALRLRTATEIDALLRTAGFAEVRYFGDWDCRPLRHDSPRVIAVATAPGKEAPLLAAPRGQA
jgi:SAM-dependent methyltransferase